MDEPTNYEFERQGTQDQTGVTDWNSEVIERGKSPIGIQSMDENLGGLQKGSVVALLMDPRGVGEKLGYHLASTGPTKYITTVRPKSSVKESFDNFGENEGVPPYSEVTEVIRQSSKQTELENIFKRESKHKNFVIDTVNGLSTGDNFNSTIRNIYTAASSKDGLTYLMFTKTGGDFTSRVEDLLHLCDVVMSVGYNVRASGRIEHTLTITKIRGNEQVPEERYGLEPRDIITLDTTRTG